LGARPFTRPEYVGKLRSMSEDVAESSEIDRFIGLVERLEELSADEVARLNVEVPAHVLEDATADRVGIL
ncbi:MAG: MmgE/PrpD family protein, partial [Candidatus Latescibacteria bacterium]|nr:MmgE/PrpD family protein [Candidatus Latescibacterota bacterium]